MRHPALLARRTKHTDNRAAVALAGARNAQFIKQWVHERTTDDVRCGRSLTLCVAAGLAAAVLSASVYGFKTVVSGHWSAGLPPASDFLTILIAVPSIAVPQVVSDWHARGRQAAQQGRIAEAVVYFQQAETACQANHPLRAQLLNELGAALIVEHKEKQAIPYLQEAVQLDPNLTAAHHNLSLCRS